MRLSFRCGRLVVSHESGWGRRRMWDAVFAAVLPAPSASTCLLPSFQHSPLLLSSLIVRFKTRNSLCTGFFHLPSAFLSLSSFLPWFSNLCKRLWGIFRALVAAVNLIKTLLNSSSNIKVRKYNKSPQRYWTGASYFIYEQESRFADTRGTGFKPTGSDGNQLEHLM